MQHQQYYQWYQQNQPQYPGYTYPYSYYYPVNMVRIDLNCNKNKSFPFSAEHNILNLFYSMELDTHKTSMLFLQALTTLHHQPQMDRYVEEAFLICLVYSVDFTSVWIESDDSLHFMHTLSLAVMSWFADQLRASFMNLRNKALQQTHFRSPCGRSLVQLCMWEPKSKSKFQPCLV